MLYTDIFFGKMFPIGEKRYNFLSKASHLSLVMTKPAFCICENKDADQLRSYREADQRLCFRYLDSTNPLLPQSKISSLHPSSIVVQAGLCQTWSETPETGFLTMRHILALSPEILFQGFLPGLTQMPEESLILGDSNTREYIQALL